MQLDVDIEPTLRISMCDKYIDRQMDHLMKALPCNGLTHKKIKCLWPYHDHVMLLRKAHFEPCMVQTELREPCIMKFSS